MRNRFVPIIVSGTVFFMGVPVAEKREPFHIEQRQYQEPDKMTYENPSSTATITRGTVGLFDYNGKWS